MAVGVAEGELGARVGALAAADRPRALWPAGKDEIQLSHEGALALGAVLAHGRRPGALGRGEDRRPHQRGEVTADRKRALHLDHGLKEGVRGPGRVGAHQDRGRLVLAHLARQLSARVHEHADVIGGGVGGGVAGVQDTCERLAGGVQIAEQRVKAEAARVGGGDALLLRVRGHQGGVDVEDDLVRARTRRPGARSGARSGRSDAIEVLGVDRGDHTPGGRVRGDCAVQIDLIAQRPQVRQAVAAVGEHHRQVAQDPPGIVGRGGLSGRRHRRAEVVCQPEPVGQLDEQRAAGVRHHCGGVRHDLYLLLARPTRHLHEILLGGVDEASIPPFSPPSRTSRRPAALRRRALLQGPG